MTVLALAVALDLLAGDPPNRWHPVAWIGALIARGRRHAPRGVDALARYGTFLIAVVAGVAAAGAVAAHAALATLPAPVALLGDAWLLKCSLSLDGLFAAVEITRGHLVAGDLAGARRQVAWHLVSRPTDDLAPPRSPPPRWSRSPRTSPTASCRPSASTSRARSWAESARASRSPGPTAR